MIINNVDQIDYFTKSVLFFVQSPNPEMNYVMISYITGAILPVVALCMTAIVVRLLGKSDNTNSIEQEIPTNTVEHNEPEAQDPVKFDIPNKTVI